VDSCSHEYQERPLDCPNAAVCRGYGRVDDAMRMTVGIIMPIAMVVVVVLAMAVLV
jgi:hypothetical protein